MGKIITKKRSKHKKSAILIFAKADLNAKQLVRHYKLTKRELLKILFLITIFFTIFTKVVYNSQIKEPENIVTIPKINKQSSISSANRQVHSELQTQFDQFINEMYLTGIIQPEERTAWLAYDLINEKPIISINADVPMQCASMVKPFIALAFFHKVKKGELIYDTQSQRLMRLMLQHSWNTATNWFIDRIGGINAVNSILYECYPDIFQQTEIVEYIPPGGGTYKNMASAEDYNRFLIAVWKNQVPYAEKIKRLMELANPGRSGEILPDTEVAHKSGTTARMCGDMAILQSRCKSGIHAYIFIGIIDRDDSVDNYLRWRRIKIDVIRKASEMIYNSMKEKYMYS